MKIIPDQAVGRLPRYRTLLLEHGAGARSHVCSHELAAALRLTDSQVRRDLMAVGQIDLINSLERLTYFSIHLSEERRHGRHEER